MNTAVKTPTNAVTAKATVGKGDVSPKFCKTKIDMDVVNCSQALLYFELASNAEIGDSENFRHGFETNKIENSKDIIKLKSFSQD